jgi:hypothetical protein
LLRFISILIHYDCIQFKPHIWNFAYLVFQSYPLWNVWVLSQECIFLKHPFCVHCLVMCSNSEILDIRHFCGYFVVKGQQSFIS